MSPQDASSLPALLAGVGAPVTFGAVTIRGQRHTLQWSVFPGGRLAVTTCRSDGRLGYRVALYERTINLEPDEILVNAEPDTETVRQPLLACGLFRDAGRRMRKQSVTMHYWRLTPEAAAALRAQLAPRQ